MHRAVFKNKKPIITVKDDICHGHFFLAMLFSPLVKLSSPLNEDYIVLSNETHTFLIRQTYSCISVK